MHFIKSKNQPNEKEEARPHWSSPKPYPRLALEGGRGAAHSSGPFPPAPSELPSYGPASWAPAQPRAQRVEVRGGGSGTPGRVRDGWDAGRGPCGGSSALAAPLRPPCTTVLLHPILAAPLLRRHLPLALSPVGWVRPRLFGWLPDLAKNLQINTKKGYQILYGAHLYKPQIQSPKQRGKLCL